ncbi:MAG: 50S ribosomal protein L28 [Patescibacteria group bacterium]
MAKCSICGKGAVSGSNVSHSQVHTKRKFKPNLQKVNGVVLCTSCLRTMDKPEKSKGKKQD